MTKINDMFQRANDLVDQKMFREAVELYKDIIEATGPTTETSFNLKLAHDLDLLSFAQHIMEIYPDSLVAYHFRLQSLYALAYYSKAYELCVEMFEQFGDNANRLSSLHSMRFHGAILASRFENLVEDFTYLWISSANSKARRKLLQHLLSVSDKEVVPALELLANYFENSPPLNQLFVSHVETIRKIDQIDF
jgi:hypothetical protein